MCSLLGKVRGTFCFRKPVSPHRHRRRGASRLPAEERDGKIRERASRQRRTMIEPDSLEPGERLLWRDRPDVATYCQRRGTVHFALGAALLALGAAVAAYAWSYGDTDSAAKFWWLPTLLGAGLLSLPLRVRR